MIRRATCLYKGKVIGIESIYTIVDGKQINIEGKVEDLRKKAQNNELFCSCGCGTNLILVAGDRGLKTQHFREKTNRENQETDCKYVPEGRRSIDSRIVLKCWLEDKLNSTTIETRVPINAIDHSDRRYEFSAISREKKVAISYCDDRTDISDEKISVLESNSSGVKLHYVVDIHNTERVSQWQYPEMMMKVQDVQGYCLFLKIPNGELSHKYSEAILYVEVYQKFNGIWPKIQIVKDKLESFSFDGDGELLYKGKSVLDIKREIEQEREKNIKEKELKKITQSWGSEYQERIDAIQEQRERDARKAEEEKTAKREQHKAEIEPTFDDDLETPHYDSGGNRWIRCMYCGKLDTDDTFLSYGGKGRGRLGTCYDCGNNKSRKILPQYQKYQPKPSQTKQRSNVCEPTCPKCGGKLKQKYGKHGQFLGCSNFPDCKYTQSFFV